MRTIKGCILGKYGVGKTSLLYTLDQERTLLLDLEAGTLSVGEFKGKIIPVRDFPTLRAISTVIAGGDPALRGAIHMGKPVPYSPEYYEAAKGKLPEINVDDFDTLFIDSVTIASKLCFTWATQQPEAYNSKGAIDTRGIYGLVGREMVAWVRHLQHAKKNVWAVGLLKESADEEGNVTRKGMAEGAKFMEELPGIFDQIITMAQIAYKQGDETKFRRGFVCKEPNPMGYPAKDRSGALNMVEPAHLGNLMQKIFTSKGSLFNPDVEEFLGDNIAW